MASAPPEVVLMVLGRGARAGAWYVRLAGIQGQVRVSTAELLDYQRFRARVAAATEIDLAPMRNHAWNGMTNEMLRPLREHQFGPDRRWGLLEEYAHNSWR